jgi:hypothetical protein
LLTAVGEEVTELRQQIRTMTERVTSVESENAFLRQHVSSEVYAQYQPLIIGSTAASDPANLTVTVTTTPTTATTTTTITTTAPTGVTATTTTNNAPSIPPSSSSISSQSIPMGSLSSVPSSVLPSSLTSTTQPTSSINLPPM